MEHQLSKGNMLNKKVVQKCTKEGGLNNYEYIEENEDIVLQEYEVLVKIACCALAENREICFQLMNKENTDYIPVGREISGVVEAAGNEVTFCKPGDSVTGIIPLDSLHSGCGTYCVLSEFDVVLKPENISHLDAACGIGDGLKAYTALFYQAKICNGETIAISSAAKGLGVLTTQLALLCGAKVIAIGSTDEDIAFLYSLDPPPNQIIDLRNKKNDIVSICLDETGGLGVDCFIDDGVEMYSEEFPDCRSDKKSNILLPSKYDVISSLAVGGRWITNQYGLQLDPPDSVLLTMKCASVHFLFEHSWTLSRCAQGKYLHILNDVMKKMEERELRPTIHHTVTLSDCIESLRQISQSNIGRILVKI